MQAKFKNKDSKIKIYELISNADGTESKKYLFNSNKMWARIRMLSSQERHDLNAEQDGTIYNVVINYREGVEQDMFVEFKGKNFQIITPPDNYDGTSIELKFNIKEVIPQ